MDARITEDVLAKCETCGNVCDKYINCNNYNCHVRFIQCASCNTNYHSCCSAVSKLYDIMLYSFIVGFIDYLINRFDLIVLILLFR